MRQKLGILGTVLTNCNLFILDEPMSGLDPRARTLVKDMLVETKAQNNTIFLSSHILADMDEICDRIAVLYDGEIRFVGTPKGLHFSVVVPQLLGCSGRFPFALGCCAPPTSTTDLGATF